MAKKNKRSLSDFSVDELHNLARKQKTTINELRALCESVTTQRDMLVMSEAQLQEANDGLSARVDILTDSLQETQEQLSQAMENNTKLQAMLDSGVGGSNIGERVIKRMDAILLTLGGEAVADEDSNSVMEFRGRGGSEGSDAMLLDLQDDTTGEAEDDLEDEDTAEFEDDSETQGDASEDDTEEFADNEEDESEDDDAEAEDEDDKAIAEFIGDEDTKTEQTDEEMDEQLSAAVLGPIQATIASLDDSDELIVAPVKNGNLSKEQALRQLVALTFPGAPDMSDAILGAPKTLAAIYTAMGI